MGRIFVPRWLYDWAKRRNFEAILFLACLRLVALLYRNDTTKTGHDLGDPTQRPSQPERERDLSATAVCVVRALMHSSFLWAACHNQHQLVDIAGVTKGIVPPQNLAEFFWFHLVKDLECMQRSTGRGVDECVMIVHLVLKEIMLANTQSSTCKLANICLLLLL